MGSFDCDFKIHLSKLAGKLLYLIAEPEQLSVSLLDCCERAVGACLGPVCMVHSAAIARPGDAAVKLAG